MKTRPRITCWNLRTLSDDKQLAEAEILRYDVFHARYLFELLSYQWLMLSIVDSPSTQKLSIVLMFKWRLVIFQIMCFMYINIKNESSYQIIFIKFSL